MADNILRIGAEFDVSQIIAGAQAAGLSFDQLVAKLQVSAAELMAQGATTKEASAILLGQGFAADAVAAALGTETVATEAATMATSGLERAASGATGRILGMEAGLGMAGGALGRVASYLPGMGPLFLAALPVALVTMAVEKIVEFRDEVEKASRQSEDFAIESYKVAESIEVENLKLGQQISTLEGGVKNNGLKIALMEAQIAADNLAKSLENDIQKQTDLMNVGSVSQIFTSASGDEKQFQDTLKPIIQEIQAARQKLAAAPPGSDEGKAALNEQIDAYKRYAEATDVAIKKLQEESAANAEAMANASEAGATMLPTNFEDSINKFREAGIEARNYAKSLESIKEHSDLTVKLGGLEDKKAAGERADKDLESLNAQQELAAKGAEEELKKIDEERTKIEEIQHAWQSYGETLVRIQTETTEMFSRTTQKETQEATIAAENRIKEQLKYEETVDKLAEETATRQITDEEKTQVESLKLQERRLDMTSLTEMQRARIHEQTELQIIQAGKNAADAILAQQVKLEEAKKALLLGGQTEQAFVVNANPEQLAQLQTINSAIEAAQAQHNAKMASLNNQALGAWQTFIQAEMNAWKPLETAIENGMAKATNSILNGTVRASEAFRRMGADIVMSMADAFEKMIIHQAMAELRMVMAHLASTQTQVATTQTGVTEQQTITLAAHIKEILLHAKAAAAGAFHWVMAMIPFPLDVILAPAAAAGAFAATMAFAEQGALLPADMPVYAHKDEMILPERIATPLQGVAPAMQKFNTQMNAPGASSQAAAVSGGDTHVHMSVAAMDQKGVEDFLHKNQAQFKKVIAKSVRNGQRFGR